MAARAEHQHGARADRFVRRRRMAVERQAPCAGRQHQRRMDAAPPERRARRRRPARIRSTRDAPRASPRSSPRPLRVPAGGNAPVRSRSRTRRRWRRAFGSGLLVAVRPVRQHQAVAGHAQHDSVARSSTWAQGVTWKVNPAGTSSSRRRAASISSVRMTASSRVTSTSATPSSAVCSTALEPPAVTQANQSMPRRQIAAGAAAFQAVAQRVPAWPPLRRRVPGNSCGLLQRPLAVAGSSVVRQALSVFYCAWHRFMSADHKRAQAIRIPCVRG